MEILAAILAVIVIIAIINPGLLAVPWVALVGLAEMIINHRERMAKIRAGIDPDKEDKEPD